MDFEAFKKSMFFLNPDNITDLELAFCEEQYQRFLQKEQDDEFFEPIETEEKTYIEYLLNFFEIPKITENQIIILIAPSFEPPSILTLDLMNTIFDYKTVDKSSWEVDNKLRKEDIHYHQAHVDTKIRNDLYEIFQFAILNAQTPKSGMFTLDGTMYCLITEINGERTMVSKNITEENTITGKITNMIEDITQSIISVMSISTSEKVLRRIDELLKTI
jgi:hypothetical protein